MTNDQRLRTLYERRDRIRSQLAAVDAEIKHRSGDWQREQKIYGLGPEGVRRMIQT
jgi:coproporphyrinogen III oxidase